MYHQDPDLTREGGSIPVTLTFAESLGVNVLLLPMGRGDDGAQYVIFFLGFHFTDPLPAQRMKSLTKVTLLKVLSFSEHIYGKLHKVLDWV